VLRRAKGGVLGLGIVSLAAAGTLARPALADDKQVCIAAAEDAQQLKLDRRLKAARERLLVCASQVCPPPVRSDCSQWMNEVSMALPTVVLGARDSHGNDVVVTEVAIDGTPIAKGLDGKAMEIDPGMHSFRLRAAAASVPVEQEVLVREGEKERPITVMFPEQASVSGPEHRAARISPWTWVLGGTGLVAIGIGTAFEVSTNAQGDSLAKTCGHMCPDAQVEPLTIKQQVVGPISFGFGAVSLGAAAYLFLSRKPESSTPSHTAFQWAIVPSSRGGTGGVLGTF
jgi:hypothetical protein